MISVPNLRLPSNGSNSPIRILLFSCLVLTLAACAGLKKAPDSRSGRGEPDTPVLEEIEGKKKNDDRVDGELVFEEEAREKENPENEEGREENIPEMPVEEPDVAPGSHSESVPYLDPGRSFELAVMLPFLGDRLDPASLSIDERALPALHFFRGMEIALDSIRQNAAFPDMNIRIYDTEANPATVYRMLSEDTLLSTADVIIGPLRPVNLEMVATIASARNQVVISPFSANSDFAAENPRFFQITPSLDAHCGEITRHIRQSWQPEQVALICRDKEAETERLALFHAANKRYSAPEDTSAFHEYIIPDTSDVYIGLDFRPLLDDSVRVFVVPSWSNRAFVYAVLRLLSSQITEEDGPVTVYGMPQWLDFDISSYEYFEKLNVHLTVPVWSDPFSPESIAFSNEYFKRYATFPTRESWLGYDMTWYLARLTAMAGLNIPLKMPLTPLDGLSTGFMFEAVSDQSDDGPEASPTIRHYANKRLYLLEFENYRFVPAHDE